MKKVFLIALVAFVYAGCGGGKDGASCTVVENTDGTYSVVCDDGTSVTFSDGTDGTKALVKTSEEPPGDNCPNGGIKIESGIDDGDGNFVGDPEVTYVCDGESGQDGQDGQDGAKALVKTSEEPPGENCPNGGIKIEAGIDDGDGNFVGEPEVTYVCDGESGEDGVSMLMITEELEEGDPDCPTGGIVVHTGADTNGNGVLDEDEITSTNYLCNGEDGEDLLLAGILEGSYTIRNNMDIHFLSSITEITGDLIVNGTGITSLSLPVLEYVGGDLSITSNNYLINIDISALTSVWRLSIFSNASLTTIDLPALDSVGSSSTIQNNAALTTIELPALDSVGSSLTIGGAGAGNPSLTTIELPSLTSVGSLSISYNYALTTIELPALESVGGNLSIRDNTVLCNSIAIAIRDQLIAAGWTGSSTISGNDNDC